MKIASTLTIDDIHSLLDDLYNAGAHLDVDDILIAVADAAAHRAVSELMEIDNDGDFVS